MTQSTYQVLKTQKLLNDLQHQGYSQGENSFHFSLNTSSDSSIPNDELEVYKNTKQMHAAKLYDIMQSMQMKSLGRCSTIAF